MERRSAILPAEKLQEKQPAVRREPPSLESGQDTTEYVLIIILFALAFTAGMMVWTRSVEGAYNGASECIASSVNPENGPSGTPLARGGDHYEYDGTGVDRPGRGCPTVR
jgi:hypothetical protein